MACKSGGGKARPLGTEMPAGYVGANPPGTSTA